jgi:hypothetical protein
MRMGITDMSIGGDKGIAIFNGQVEKMARDQT